MPATRPGIQFNEEGICYPCLEYEKRKLIDWEERWTQLESLCDQYRGKQEYDMLIPCSGGKDSHWQVHVFKELLGMNPLCLMIDNSSWTKTGRSNFYNLCERFDIDFITFTPALKTLKDRVLKDFIENLHPMRYWDELLYSVPNKFAKKLGINLIAWGENPGKFIGGNTPRVFDEALEVIYLSDYTPWSRYANVAFSKANGFKGLDDTGEWVRDGMQGFEFEQVDTIGYLTNNYCKFIKFGFSSQTEDCSDAIREGKMTRREALENVYKYDWRLDVKMEKDFCKFIGITQKQFWNIIDSHANTNLLKKVKGLLWKLKEDA
jgi:hypothetical protein